MEKNVEKNNEENLNLEEMSNLKKDYVTYKEKVVNIFKKVFVSASALGIIGAGIIGGAKITEPSVNNSGNNSQSQTQSETSQNTEGGSDPEPEKSDDGQTYDNSGTSNNGGSQKANVKPSAEEAMSPTYNSSTTNGTTKYVTENGTTTTPQSSSEPATIVDNSGEEKKSQEVLENAKNSNNMGVVDAKTGETVDNITEDDYRFKDNDNVPDNLDSSNLQDISENSTKSENTTNSTNTTSKSVQDLYELTQNEIDDDMVR